MSEPTPDRVQGAFDRIERISPDPDISAPEQEIPDDSAPPIEPPRTPYEPHREEAPKDPVYLASRQPLNDYGNGQRYVIHYGDDVMFVPRVGWFEWTEKVWSKDADELRVRRKAQGLAELITKELDHMTLPPAEMEILNELPDLNETFEFLSALPVKTRTEEQAAEFTRVRQRLEFARRLDEKLKKYHDRRRTHARNAGNTGPLKNLLHESQTGLAVAFEDLDTGALDVNINSGVLRFKIDDLREEGSSRSVTCELLPHFRNQRLTKIVPVEYRPGQTPKAPKFHAFLNRVQPDREMRDFLKRWLGYSMLGLKTQKLAFFYGSGANGKSVLVDLIGRILADYSASMKIESLTGNAKRSGAEATPDLIPLLGARFVRTSEPDQGEKLQEGLIKQLTGGEPIPVRPNYGDQIDMDPFFKLTMSGNHKPEIRGTDDGIWRRVMLVPFEVQIPESERDLDLGEKLWAERDGVFAWLVEGAIDFLEGGLCPPQSILDATKEYREESDPIGVFLTSCCVVTGRSDDKIASKLFGEAFNYYLLERGLSTWKPTTFAKQIATKSKQWKHPETGLQFTKGKASVTQYTGLRLEADFKARFDRAPKDASGKALGVTLPEEGDLPPTPDPDVSALRD